MLNTNRKKKWTFNYIMIVEYYENKIRFKRNKNFTYNANEILLSKSGHLKPKLIRAP